MNIHVDRLKAKDKTNKILSVFITHVRQGMAIVATTFGLVLIRWLMDTTIYAPDELLI